MRKPRVGLLPFYLELYDLTAPEIRPDIDRFHRLVGERLAQTGLEVVNVPVCRLKNEFESAVKLFEDAGVDAVVTLHLAYSPSLESEGALKDTALPLIVLDTTPSLRFDGGTPADAIMLNHGIHGVQDMCNLLRRNGKAFALCAGHLDGGDVLCEVKRAATAAMLKRSFCSMRVGTVGKPFSGMGDFFVEESALREEFGITVTHYDYDMGARLISEVSREETDREFLADSSAFEIDERLTDEVYRRSARVALGIRKWLEREELTALTINFLETEGSPAALPVMPFTECSKAMARGLGYAGEGDVLTAALVGALLGAYEHTTFAEMFCPDWEHGSVFLSHMGEFNCNIAAAKPYLTEKPFPFTSAENPTVAYGTMMGGRATYVNLAPLGGGRYALILARGEMLCPEGENKLAGSVNGWFKPELALPEFLKRFSSAGGTHHGAVVYGDASDVLERFGGLMGFEVVSI